MIAPPITSFEHLYTEWQNDSSIDPSSLDVEMLRIPNLHAKYVHVFSFHSLRSKQLRQKLAQEKKIKFRYYRGNLNNKEDLQEHNLEPLHERVPDKELPLFVETDPVLQRIQAKIDFDEEIVSFCDRILKELNSRTWQIRATMDFLKYMNP